jgi:hypothetical protein
VGVTAALIVCAAFGPRNAAAQFSDPCRAACKVTLGATGVVAATGTIVAVGRLSGGFATTSQAAWVGGAGLVAVLGAGVALRENGERQERAIYAAAIGAAAGSLASFGIAALTDDSNGARMLAASLIGATAGTVLGGVYGALTHDDGSAGGSVPLFSLSLPF